MEIKCGISLGHTIYNILRENKILSRFYFFSFLTLSLPRTRYLATTMSLVQLRGQVISLSQCSLLGALNVHIYICILYYIIFILIIHILLLYYNIETIRYSSQFLFCGSINEIFFMYTSLFVLLCLSLGVNNTMLLIRQFERDFLFVIWTAITVFTQFSVIVTPMNKMWVTLQKYDVFFIYHSRVSFY